jgi:membrane protein implicated in regulation of membrane protease activity
VILLLVFLIVVFAPLSTSAMVVLLLVGCVLEVVEIGLLRRWSRRIDKRTKPTTGAAAMIGQPVEVIQACHPKGVVQLGGELWEARCDEGAEPGETVKVAALEGLTLVVAH